MIRLGLRLTLRGGRDTLVRVAVTAAAVALGVSLLLCVLAGVNGLRAQADRGAWLDTSAQTATSSTGATVRPTLVALHRGRVRRSGDRPRRRGCDRPELADATGDSPRPLRGRVLRVTGPCTDSIATVPTNELGDRFPGKQVGTIDSAALPSPDSLVAIVGHDAHTFSHVHGVQQVRGIQQTLADCYGCQGNSGSGSAPILKWILAGVAVVLVVPVLILIATASRMAAARREERFAAMRLVGATPHQVSMIAAVEASVAAFAGVAVGFAFYLPLSLLMARIPFTGASLAPGDLSLTLNDVLFVVIGVPIAAMASARVGLRRVRISPLGVTRRASSTPPSPARVIPLVTGIVLLAYFAIAGKPQSNTSQLLELVGGLLLILVGLVLAGPWLTRMGSLLLAMRAKRAATLIAGRRLLDNPRAAFRAISGLVLALFVTSATIVPSARLSPRPPKWGLEVGNHVAAQFCGLSTRATVRTRFARSLPGYSGSSKVCLVYTTWP